MVDCVRPAGMNVIVWLLFCSSTPFLFLYRPSNLVPLALSLTIIEESWPDSKSSLLMLTSWLSEITCLWLVIILLIVFGSWPVCRSKDDLFVADGYIFEQTVFLRGLFYPSLLLFSYSFLVVRFLVRISLSIIPFPLWSLIGHSMWFMYHSLQNSLILWLLKIVAGSVLIVLGIPCLVMYFFKNSITFSVFGFLRNFASGHPL